MKNLAKFLSIIGLVSMSHVAVAIDNVSDGDVLTADKMNDIIDDTNANSAGGFDFEIDNPCGGGTVYSVGDTGPEGGLVAIVTEDGCDGMEAWTADEGQSLYGCDGTETGATLTGIGGGGPNSAVILDAGCGTALDLVRAADYNGAGDWFLPSRDELTAMYNTIGPRGSVDPSGNAGGFITGVYWTSSEISATHVYGVNFENGSAPSQPKDFNRYIRAVRYFTQ